MKSLNILVLVVLAALCCADPLDMVFVSGNSPFEIGTGIGKALKADFDTLLEKDTDFLEKIVPWARKHPNEITAMLASGAKAYPDIAAELRGIAVGMGRESQNVSEANFLEIISVRPEIESFLKAEENYQSTRGCCDVLLRSKDGKNIVHAHNEDWDQSLRSLTKMLCVHELFPGKTPRTLFGLVYPGYLLGNTFGWTTDGFSLSTNAMPPKGDNAFQGVARYWANRDILSATSYEDAITRVHNAAFVHGLVHGYATSIANHKSGKLINFESAHNRIAEKSLEKGEWIWHVNMYTRMENITQYESISSEHRKARLVTFNIPSNASDVEKILGDRGDSQWPIYRNATPPDSGATLATAVFDLTAGIVKVYSLANPSLSNPVLVLKLPVQFGDDNSSANKKINLVAIISLAAFSGLLLVGLIAVSAMLHTALQKAQIENRPLIQ